MVDQSLSSADLLRCETRAVGRATVLTAIGEIDSLTAPRLHAALRQAQAATPVVVLDLGGVEFLGSSGLMVLMRAANEALDAPAGPPPLRIVAARSRVVVRAIQAAGLIGMLPLFDSLEHALA
ncbi:MAG TPA: STAS domain-containing protein [Pseudonocardia sp.]|jgi:anti-sigma B factor antagonist